MIKRSPRKENFTVLDNETVSDERLSWSARGLHHYLLSKPDAWQVSVGELMKRGDLGRDSIYKRLKELASCSYAKARRTRNSDGTLGETDWIIYDRPYTDSPDTANQDVVKSADNRKSYVNQEDRRECRQSAPYPDSPDTAKSTLVNTDSKQRLIRTKRANGVDSFDRFWTAYPKKRSKDAALRAWRKIKPDEQLAAEIISAVERAKTQADWRKDEGQFIPYPATWLNAGGWKDELEPETKREFVC